MLADLLASPVEEGSAYPLWNTLGNDGNGFDLRALHQLHSRAVDGAGGGEVDNGINIGVFGHGLGDVLVDGQEGFAGSPVPEGLIDVQM